MQEPALVMQERGAHLDEADLHRSLLIERAQMSSYNVAAMSGRIVMKVKVSTRYFLLAFLTGASLACDVITPVTPGAVGKPSGAKNQENVVSTPAASDFAVELTLCVDETNRYRASVGRPALTRSAALEAFAAEAARQDTLVHQAHYYFKSTNGNNIARAENEILWWRGFTIQEVVRQGLAQMWRSGPSGEHYDIIVGPYTHVGCGIYVNGREVTVAQDFH